MKKLLLTATLACAAITAFAQGQLNFANDANTRLYTNSTATPAPPAGSSTYKAGIYWGPVGTPEGSLNLLPASSNGVTTTWSPFSGIFSGGTATFPTLGQVAVQIRVWGANFADYASALAGGAPQGVGKGIIQTITLGNPNATPIPELPASLTAPGGGGTPFQRFAIAPVPEPSSIALGLLGLGAIVLFRRRK
jgi:hypothetical protein